MDIVAGWGWQAWSLAALAVVVGGWFLFRYLAALMFRHVLLAGVAARHGWHVDTTTGDHGRARFEDQERRRRKKAWTLLRQGTQGLREGYRTGVFGRTPTGAWHRELTITGTWQGRQFTATQIRRYEMSTGHEGVHRKTRRRATLHLSGQYRQTYTKARWPHRTYRTLKADAGGLELDLGPRLRRGQLLRALTTATEAADRLQTR
jgi:hypothetical protein